MSGGAPTHGHAGGAHERTTEEPASGMNSKLIVIVGAASLAIFAISAWVAYVLLIRTTEQLHAERGEAVPAEQRVGKAEIGIVDNVHFDHDTRLADWRKMMAGKAASYGWSGAKDAQGKALARIPIERAVAQVIADNRHDSGEVKALPWGTAPPAPGTLEAVIHALKPGVAATPAPVPAPRTGTRATGATP